MQSIIVCVFVDWLPWMRLRVYRGFVYEFNDVRQYCYETSANNLWQPFACVCVCVVMFDKWWNIVFWQAQEWNSQIINSLVLHVNTIVGAFFYWRRLNCQHAAQSLSFSLTIASMYLSNVTSIAISRKSFKSDEKIHLIIGDWMPMTRMTHLMSIANNLLPHRLHAIRLHLLMNERWRRIVCHFHNLCMHDILLGILVRSYACVCAYCMLHRWFGSRSQENDLQLQNKTYLCVRWPNRNRK